MKLKNKTISIAAAICFALGACVVEDETGSDSADLVEDDGSANYKEGDFAERCKTSNALPGIRPGCGDRIRSEEYMASRVQMLQPVRCLEDLLTKNIEVVESGGDPFLSEVEKALMTLVREALVKRNSAWNANCYIEWRGSDQG